MQFLFKVSILYNINFQRKETEKLMKKALSLVLSVLLIFSSLSVAGFAKVETEVETEVETYNLRVGSVIVNSTNKNDILGNGTASFDEASNTLTLKDACISEYSPIVIEPDAGSSDSVAAYIYYSGSKDLHIKLLGKNKIMRNGPDMDSPTLVPHGIYSADSNADILFEGDGSLLIAGAINDGVFSNGGIKVNGQKFIIKTEGKGLHAMYRPLVIEGNTFLDIDSMYGIYNKYESVDIRGGKIKILCPNYGIYSGKESEDNHIITISGGDIVIEEKTEIYNPIFVGKDITISGGRIFSRSYCGLWSNGTIHVTGGYIDLKAKVDGLLQTGEKDHIFITGGTLILETEEGNAFSYKEGSGDSATYPAQKPILDEYENVSIDYGSDFDNLKKGQNLESAEKDRYWESQLVIIRAKNDPKPKPKSRNTVVIEIGPKAEELLGETESNPDTGAPIPGIGRTISQVFFRYPATERFILQLLKRL